MESRKAAASLRFAAAVHMGSTGQVPCPMLAHIFYGDCETISSAATETGIGGENL
jgi:hypothetical protein